MSLPSMRQLQYFLAVYELRHFAQAAERCFVTQSTLSSGIQELEILLDTQLFERSKRKVIPTLKGEQLAKVAEQVLSLTAEMVEMAKGSDSPLAGPLKMGIIPTISPFLLPSVLPVVRKTYPLLELYLVEDQSAKLIERLQSGELDCAIFALPYDIGTMEFSKFWEECFWVALPEKHELSKGGAISSSDLPENELLLLEEGHCFRDHALSACHKPSLKNSSAFQGTSIYTLLEMVAGGQGITFLPEMAIKSKTFQQGGVSLRPLSEKGPHREIAVVYRSNFYRKDDIQLLAKTMGKIMETAKN